MFALVVKRPAALGNGTRPKDFILAMIDVSYDDVGELPKCAWEQSLKGFEDKIDLNDGVDLVEVVNALRSISSGNVQLVDPTASEPTSDGPLPSGEVPIEELDLKSSVIEKLVSAGLKSVQQVIDFGDKHKGLTSIDGIGESTEAEVIEAVRKLKASQPA